ncbi:MAG TPA: D-alanyl-D-alanine carboxypeptidase/D-alanyl-D-alanine-endopeptidase [Patescibacteria group bacterium]|nr:D-alanyl-D-alanine carboxypeptidase/D-alanyl-D-alanine-endopeptidase [Patescibacteria group bacterium]
MPPTRLATLLALALALPGGAAATYAARPQSQTSVPAAAPSPLVKRLNALVASPVFHPEETGIALVALPEGRTVFARNATRLLRPASTLKIVTTAAALALLKPEFAYETRVYADAPVDASGTLTGNLYLQGRGAPDLVGESWWLLTRRLADTGLRRVEGNLIADEAYFDTVRRPPGWPPPSADSWYNAPIGALSCNFNVVTVHVEPSPLAGARPDLTLEPIASYFQVLNRATTGSQPTDIRVDRGFEDGRNTLVVGGTIRRGSEAIVVHRGVEEPALYALHAFREIARSSGIEIAGALSTGLVPDGARTLARQESRPLAQLVRDMNKNSNNFMAEMLLKTLGAQFVSVPGTTAGGLEMVRAYLSGIGLDPAATALADGSGLSDQSRASAALLAGVLAKAQADFEIGPELVSSLPIGGADGTLSERFGGEATRRRVRAKTGRIAGAISLAGYVTNRSGRMFAFVVLANQPRGTIEAVHRAIDPMVDAVAESTDDDLPPADAP